MTRQEIIKAFLMGFTGVLAFGLFLFITCEAYP